MRATGKATERGWKTFVSRGVSGLAARLRDLNPRYHRVGVVPKYRSVWAVAVRVDREIERAVSLAPMGSK
jgi:hypothetical protein